MENWIRILQGDLDKVWNCLKIKIRKRTTKLQVKQWVKASEGVVLKKYKTDWWVDTQWRSSIDRPKWYRTVCFYEMKTNVYCGMSSTD